MEDVPQAEQKDDKEPSQIFTFGVLAFCTACVLCLWAFNFHYILKNGRFRNIALALFYLFSFLTLLCKPLTLFYDW